MPYVSSIGTYLPCWGGPQHRVPGDDEDAITLAVEAGRAALIASGAVERVVLVSRDLPLLESSNAAVLLAGLGLDPELEVDERLGGAPATLDAVSSARPRTLIIGTDLDPAGAAAILTAERGLQVRTAARVARSLPVRTRNATGDVHDYGDPRLLHERGLVASLAAAWLDTPAAVAGVEHDRAVQLCVGNPPPLPHLGCTTAPRRATAPPHSCWRQRMWLSASPIVRCGSAVSCLGLDSVMHQHKSDMTTFPATTRAAKQAFAMAGMTPADVDVAEVHDFFTGIELISYEHLGFAERFGGYKLVEAEVTSVGGALPVNPSGGLKAKGHPPGATGVAQCVELFAQLRGEAANQVDGARVALAHNIGGPTAVSAVTILEGSANGAR